jgi:hypothetical protein
MYLAATAKQLGASSTEGFSTMSVKRITSPADASLSQKISHTDSDDSATDNDDIRPFHSLSPSLQRLNGKALLPHKYNELWSPNFKNRRYTFSKRRTTRWC